MNNKKDIESDIFNINSENEKLGEIAQLLDSNGWIAYKNLLETNLSNISNNILKLNSSDIFDDKKRQDIIYKFVVRAEIIRDFLNLPERANIKIQNNNQEVSKLKSLLNKIIK